MSIELEDLVGLNRTEVLDLPIVDSHATASSLLDQPGSVPLSIAGMHHSQGGHTVVQHGRVLLTEGMNERIEVHPNGDSVTVDAGVTWAEMHHVLFKDRLCPIVHQSSPHFTVGGSISVNCHGRDPHAGPISTTVRNLTVLCGDRNPLEASASENTNLFRAVIGGYGSCGLILRATLDVRKDQWLEQVGEPKRLSTLADKLRDLAAGTAAGNEVELFYAWLCCVPPIKGSGGTGGPRGPYFYDDALAVEYRPTNAGGMPDTLENQGWGMSEMMRAAWSAARVDRGMRVRVWQDLLNEFTTRTGTTPWPRKRRINWMRSSVDFASQRDDRRSDILLEYFLPVDSQIEERIETIGGIFLRHQANILSTTLRLVRPDRALPYLAYCAEQPMICMAIDVDIATERDATGRRSPGADARTWIHEATHYVLGQGGTYYLPYFGFADLDTFRKAYGRNGASWQSQQQAIQTYNPQKRFWSNFLDQYLDPNRP